MIIKKLYDSDCFNYERFILNNINALSLSLNDSVILIKILDNYKNSNIFDKEKIKENINIKNEIFEESLGSLLEKNYFSIYLKEENEITHELFSVDGFFEKCEVILDLEFNPSDSLNEIMNLVSMSFNRILTASDIEIIKSLVLDSLFDINDFKIALNKLESKSIKNIKTLSKELERTRENKKEKNEAPLVFKEFINKIK